MSYSLSPGSPQTLQSAATTGTGGILLIRGQCERVTVVLESSGTTSGGAVTIEEAYYPDDGLVYAGTWSTIGSAINASSFTGGAQLAVHILDQSIWALRVRISSNITGGGTISAYAWGN